MITSFVIYDINFNFRQDIAGNYSDGNVIIGFPLLFLKFGQNPL